MRKKNPQNFVSNEIQVNLRKIIIVRNSVLPDQKKNIFTRFPGTNNGMAHQSKPGIGIHGSDKIQDHNSSSSNTQGREKKQNNKLTKKNGQREMYQKKKKDIKYSSKEILIRLYFISSISSASLRVSLSAVSNRVFLTA